MSSKQRITVQLSGDLLNRVKNAVYWTPGLTIASLLEEALEKKLEKIEQKNGGQFQQRPEELKAGRPLK